MADLWFYTRGGKQMEPVSAAELKELATRGALKPTDMVWREGMPQWIRAATAQGLFDQTPAYASPQPATPYAPAPQPYDPTRRSGSGRTSGTTTASGVMRGGRRGMSAGAKVAIILGVTL